MTNKRRKNTDGSDNNNNNNNKKRKSTGPLAPPPHSQSRKRARQVTTLFHKYTRQRDAAVAQGQETDAIDAAISSIGGRREYQRASQVSTAFHSTSKWVLGCLARNGWLYGIVVQDDENDESSKSVSSKSKSNRKRQKRRRRPTRLLEIGAINTELLDAAAATKETSTSTTAVVESKKKYRLHVRAIDIHSMRDGIEEADFLTLPVHPNINERYDVIVCSMVLNCVTTPADRGEMLARLYHFLRPNGLVFLTIPKTCLHLSKYCDQERFERMLEAVGLQVVPHEKDSPKVAFFVCKRPAAYDDDTARPTLTVAPQWTKNAVIRRGKKYRNEFAVSLSNDSVAGISLTFSKKPMEGEDSD